MENALLYSDNKIYFEGFIDYNDKNKIREQTIYWKWPFETGTTQDEIYQNNLDDSAWMNIPVSLSIDITGEQVSETPTLQNTVIFDSNGGTITSHNSKIATRQINSGEEFGDLPECNKKGYTFDGWYTGKTDGDKIDSTTIMSEQDVIYYAHWRANEYKVEFNTNGRDEALASKTVIYESNYGKLPTPTKTGYTFDGWFTTPDGGEKITEGSLVTIADNHTIYALWTFNIYDLHPVINVNESSNHTGEYFGGLYSSELYQGTVNWIAGMDAYSDNDGKFQYDEEGAMLLDSDNAIPILEIDENYDIGNVYSISTTIKGDIAQKGDSFTQDGGNANLPATILAISGANTNYLTWIGFYCGYLQVYSYYLGPSKVGILNERTDIGFASIDISEYSDQTINIQVTAVRNGKTKVYINGELISEFDSGDAELDYAYLTIGDLRVGRGLKFTGKLYNFSIFDTELTAEQVQSNYENSKRYISD